MGVCGAGLQLDWQSQSWHPTPFVSPLLRGLGFFPSCRPLCIPQVRGVPGFPLPTVKFSLLSPLPGSQTCLPGLPREVRREPRRVCAGNRSGRGSFSSHLQEVKLEGGGQTRGGGARCHGEAQTIRGPTPPAGPRSGIPALAGGPRALSSGWPTPAQIVNQSPNTCSRGKSDFSRTRTRRKAGSISVGTC